MRAFGDFYLFRAPRSNASKDDGFVGERKPFGSVVSSQTNADDDDVQNFA